jgi:shikimate dehydrogenase
MGHPISHSKSPFIHTEFARQTSQVMVYRAIQVPPGGFERALKEFQQRGGKGLNITLPFKEEAWRLAAHLTARAQQAEAVNTLWFDATGQCWGDNTDGLGLVRDLLLNQGLTLEGKAVLLLGAGGAARGVLGPLLGTAPSGVVVANRTWPRAKELAARFAAVGPVEACAFEALEGRQFDLIINATSASLEGVVPPIPDSVLRSGGWCYDLMYSREATSFVRWGQARNASRAMDGLGMLVEQAGESFYRWRGIRPDTVPVILALRTALQRN